MTFALASPKIKTHLDHFRFRWDVIEPPSTIFFPSRLVEVSSSTKFTEFTQPQPRGLESAAVDRPRL